MTITAAPIEQPTSAEVVVTLYARPMCTQSVETHDALRRAGIPFTYVDITHDPEACEYLASLECYVTPVVTATVDDRTYAWVGHDPSRVVALARAVAARRAH